MSASYKQLLRVIEKWPLDATKEGRDLGQHIRTRVAQGFRLGANSDVDEKKCQRAGDSLHRLAYNVYFDRYPYRLQTGAVGLTAEQSRWVISNEGLKVVEVHGRSYPRTLLHWFKTKLKRKSK